MDCSLPGSSIHGIFQARVLEWGAIPFLPGILPSQGSNPRPLHCRQTLYHLSHQGSPRMLEWVPFPSPGGPPGVREGGIRLYKCFPSPHSERSRRRVCPTFRGHRRGWQRGLLGQIHPWDGVVSGAGSRRGKASVTSRQGELQALWLRPPSARSLCG